MRRKASNKFAALAALVLLAVVTTVVIIGVKLPTPRAGDGAEATTGASTTASASAVTPPPATAPPTAPGDLAGRYNGVLDELQPLSYALVDASGDGIPELFLRSFDADREILTAVGQAQPDAELVKQEFPGPEAGAAPVLAAPDGSGLINGADRIYFDGGEFRTEPQPAGAAGVDIVWIPVDDRSAVSAMFPTLGGQAGAPALEHQ
ncbi:hypothetical protein [Corynebacterium uterequi]|uniref:Uncharacterized protein n=1 Tax=Corynebacterium uterequi TaxID=1072256 RepID=A0A0G3HBK4_9CORY|nr:hypothetical protein [Corynebacterium uterequi]AKK10634.1 hypothetical protein CUTER_03125 [Corynebacterium uterequi]